MPELLLSIFFSYKNAQIAKTKGLNTIIWVLLTLLAFFTGELIAGTIAIALFYSGPLDQKSVADFVFIHPTPLRVIFIYFTGVGGCLFIRYILEQMRGNLPEKPREDDNEADNHE
ncbi:hypothetical protein [Polluticoccus soli]|uniref:hypothetical protein n=1 Tax=Polluticoccus soli TaxID=3034150 RepID=UPI0023E1A15C|nr:hypothetical protein [Flavipsychrobacter sp. JY13-12]